MIGSVVSEHVYKIFSHSTVLCAITFNSVLIYCLIYSQVKHVGPYRWLLVAFALLNIFISILNALVFPFAHITEFGYILWGYNCLNQPTSAGFGFILAWLFLFYQTFIFLTFLYVYRFVVICRYIPFLAIFCSQNNDLVLQSIFSLLDAIESAFWIIMVVVVDIVYAGSIVFASGIGRAPSEKNRRAFAPVMKEVYGIDLFSNNLPGYIALAYWIPLQDGVREWQWMSIMATLSGCVIIFTALFVIIICLIRIQRHMSNIQDSLASNTRLMQNQLMRALIAQTVFPTISAYIPIGFGLTFPLFLEYPLGGVGTILLMSIELFPIFDPLIIMVCVKGYRPVLPKCLRKLMRMEKTSTVSTSNMQFTSQAN